LNFRRVNKQFFSFQAPLNLLSDSQCSQMV
jgi:hypothetical protein